ncbi:MAG: caspase family protein [Bacteroidota bacterium]
MRLFISLFIFLLGSHLANGQELARIQYEDDDGIKYDGLLVNYAPDDVHIRLAFEKDGKEYVVHLEYEILPARISSKSGEEYILMRQDPSWNIKDGFTDANNFVSDDILEDFVPHSFIWYPDSKINPGDERPFFFEGSARYADKKMVDSYEIINPEDVTKDFLLKFFKDNDKEYLELEEMCRVDESDHRALPPLKIKPTMHFMMVVNSGDEKIGVSCSKDQEKLDKEFSAIARTLGIPYKPYLIYCANDLTKIKLQSELNKLNPTPNDIVIFSYSGHGSRWSDQKDQYPFMNLWVTPPFNNEPQDQAELLEVKKQVNQNSLGLSEVYQQITKKNARLNIILGDLCNTSIGVPRPVNTESYLTFGHRDATGFLIRDTVKLRKLFINAKGNLLSTAAKPDQAASGNSTSGGYYTTGFIDALREAASFRNNSPTWESIINKTINNALAYRKRAEPNEVQNGIRYNKIIE